MDEKYNGLTKALLLFQKESGCKLVPVANLQPAYGPWESLEDAQQGLIDVFESIENVPAEYTFCVLKENSKPQEWWFTEKGVWETIAPKSVGDSLENVLIFRYNEVSQDLEVSYDGGDTWTTLVNIPTMTGNYVTDWKIDSNTGEIKISYDNGITWLSKGQIKFEITNTGYFRYTFDGGNTWKKIKIIAAEALSGGDTPGGGDASGPIETITPDTVGEVEFQNSNDASSGTYTGIDASNVLIYMAIDYPTSMNTFMEARYPNVAIGSYVIIRSTMYDRTGGMSNASDATHTYELDPTWTTQDVLDNSTQSDWYHYYQITKVDVDKWAALAWTGRVPAFQDVTRHKVYIDTIVPVEASVVVTYNGVDTTVRPGGYITVDDGASVTITGTAEGFNNYTNTLTNITSDQHINVVLTEERESVMVYFSSAPDDGVWGVSTDNFQTIQYYRHSLGWENAGLYEFPKGTTVQVFYFCASTSSMCFNVAAWNLSEGISSVVSHPSRVYLGRGLNYLHWNSYTLNEDTVFDPNVQPRTGTYSEQVPSLPQDKMLLIFDRTTCNGDVQGTSYHNMDSTGHFNITITFEEPSPFPDRPPRQREVLTYSTTNRYFFIDYNEIPDWVVVGATKFIVNVELVGGATEYRNTANIADKYWSDQWRWHNMPFLPTGYYSLGLGTWDPSSLHLDMNGVEITPSTKAEPRYFTDGTTFNFTATADLYYPKTWTDVMPASDYTLPPIILERDYS